MKNGALFGKQGVNRGALVAVFRVTCAAITQTCSRTAKAKPKVNTSEGYKLNKHHLRSKVVLTTIASSHCEIILRNIFISGKSGP